MALVLLLLLLLLVLQAALPAHLGTVHGWRCMSACVETVWDANQLLLGMGLPLQWMPAVMMLQLPLLTPVVATWVSKNVALLAILLLLALGQGLASRLRCTQNSTVKAAGFGALLMTTHLLHA